jgi:hypothetical protein
MKASKQEREAMAAEAIRLMIAARECDKQASKERKRMAEEHGAGNFPNRYPVSGGICEHWPEEEKEIIRKYNRFRAEFIDESFDLWRESGKRSHTWKTKFQEITK